MAGQKNIKQNNKKGFDLGKNLNLIYFIALALLLFYISAVFDETISSVFKNIKITPLDFVFGIITNFGIVVLSFLAIPALILYRKNRKDSFFLIIAFASAFLLSFAIKLIVLRQRPMETLYYPLMGIINYSFPSMHSMAVFALLPLLIHFFPGRKHFWISAAFLVAFTRIYLNFHYLSDVVFGIIAGYIIGRFFLKLYKKRHHEKN